MKWPKDARLYVKASPSVTGLAPAVNGEQNFNPLFHEVLNMNAKSLPWYAAGDPWVLTQNEWDPAKNTYFETIFTQSNGYMGIRGYTEEANAGVKGFREGYLAGVFGHIDEAAFNQIRVEYPWPMLAMVTMPELFSCAIQLNGEDFRLSSGTVAFFSRSLNMRNGILNRYVVWESPDGRRTRLQFERFLSAAEKHLGMQRITVTPENWSGNAALTFEIDGNYPTYFRCGDRAMAHLPQSILEKPGIITGDRVAAVTVRTRGTGHTISFVSAVAGGRCQAGVKSGAASQQSTLSLRVGESASVVHTVVVLSTRDGLPADELPARGARLVRRAMKAGYDRCAAESADVWTARWQESDVAIEGPARDQAYARFSSFSMLQMAPFHTDNMSIPARAYAFNRYHGLYYWDSETFLLPHYLHTHPQVAENLLSFRHRTLDGARRTARQLRSPGACFPWMTDSDEGNEQAPWGIGDYVWHQNADIAYAIDQYAQATGNIRFMLDKGLEAIAESARFWMSRLEEDADGVMHLHNTVGPDEIDKHGKDNGYSSLMARRHLRLAVDWAERLKELFPREGKALCERLELSAGELKSWRRAADRMAVPMVPGRNFPLQDEFLLAKKPLKFDGLTADEAFAKRHTHRVVKQADIIVALCLLQDEFTVEQMRDAYDFYEPMTLHYSSLSYNTHSIIATKIGRDEQAYDYFLKAAGLDLDNLRDATVDGLHAAALGGTWQTIAYGFLGMRLEKESILFEPRLPAAWKSLSLHIAYRGYRLALTISHDELRIDVRHPGGNALPARLVLNGEAHELHDGLSIASGHSQPTRAT